jgi:Arc/MetJ family transcription regulator
LEQAKTLAGLPTKRETVDAALQEFIQHRLRRQLLQLRGQIEYFEDYDYKALRRLKQP